MANDVAAVLGLTGFAAALLAWEVVTNAHAGQGGGLPVALDALAFVGAAVAGTAIYLYSRDDRVFL